MGVEHNTGNNVRSWVRKDFANHVMSLDISLETK